MLNLPGIEKDKVSTAVDLLNGKKVSGERVIMVGGGLVGCETALWLANQGKDVTIIEALPELLSSGKPVPHMNRTMLLDLLKYNKVKAITNSSLIEVTDDGAIIIDKNFRKKSLEADTVVIAVGFKSDNKLYYDIEGKVSELYAIGDAREAANIMNAIWDAYEVARNI